MRQPKSFRLYGNRTEIGMFRLPASQLKDSFDLISLCFARHIIQVVMKIALRLAAQPVPVPLDACVFASAPPTTAP